MEIERFLAEDAHQLLNGEIELLISKKSYIATTRKLAAHYNVNMSTLITNVLLNWKEENEEDKCY